MYSRWKELTMVAMVTAFVAMFYHFSTATGRTKLTARRIWRLPAIKAKPVAALQKIKLAEFTSEEILHINNKSVKVGKPGIYSDPAFLVGGCKVNSGWRDFEFKLMTWWMKLAAKHKITWFLTYGSLVGGVRHQDYVPWDHDADIGVLEQDVELLRTLETPRLKINYTEIQLICRPAEYCKYYGSSSKRVNCYGKRVTSQSDKCAFCGPVCRVYTSGGFMDLWVYGMHADVRDTQDMKVKVMDEGQQTLYDVDLIFPLKKCHFMGLTVLCPQKSKTYLDLVYGTWHSYYKCVNATWFLKSELKKKGLL